MSRDERGRRTYRDTLRGLAYLWAVAMVGIAAGVVILAPLFVGAFLGYAPPSGQGGWEWYVALGLWWMILLSVWYLLGEVDRRVRYD